MIKINSYLTCILISLIGSSVFGQNSDELYEQAQALYEKGEYQDVVHLLQPISDIKDDGEVEMLMGDAEHKMEYFDMAIKHYQEAEKAGLNTVDLYFHRGAAYISIGNYSKATKDLTKAIDIDPENAELYFYRGYAYTEMDKSEKALADYSNAILYNPDYAEAYYNRGAVKIDLGLLDEGGEDLEESQRIGGVNLDVGFNLAIIAFDKEDYNRAIELFENLVETDDDVQKVDAFYYLAECNYRLGNTEDACRYFYKAMSLGDKDSEEVYYNFCEKGQIRKMFKARRKTEKVTF
jgi:tetratricopeptide (TPR) repeat protein